MSTIVLVHGAYHGSWCWRDVKAAVEARGHTVATPDLDGLETPRAGGEQLTFNHWVRALSDVIEKCGEPVVLVGHSRSGLVISAVAEAVPEALQSLVYVSAYLPRSGESLLDLAQQDAETELRGYLQPSADGRAYSVAPEGARLCFYHLCSDAHVAYAAARLRTEPAFGLTEKILLSAERFGRVPRHYIAGRQDKAIGYRLQQQMYSATPCESVTTLDCDHSAFFSAPDELAREICRISDLR